MKRIITLLIFGLFILAHKSNAQKIDYENSSRWFWGLNTGAAWNTTDVKNKLFYGAGATFGRSFGYNPGNALSFDLRLRYLGGAWYGQDYDTTDFILPNNTLSTAPTNYYDSLGYSINNFKAKVHELDLELALHFNRFMDRTGWDPYIFGGVGITWWQTRGDLLNNQDAIYDYNAMDDYSKGSINETINHDYDTPLDGSTAKFNTTFMPSAGIGIGYYFGQRFSVGIEHKTTFTLLDNFDGVSDEASKIKNDWYHYTNLYFKYYLKWRGDGSASSNNNTNGNTNNLNNGGTGDCQKPMIGLVNPATYSANSSNQTYNFKVKVAHVTSRDNITVTVNGTQTTNFVFNAQTNELDGSAFLQPGTNTINIIATNSCGSTTENLAITYTSNCINPVVMFTNPVNSGTTVSSNSFYVSADISNMPKDGFLTFLVNGRSVSSYNWNYQTGKFNSTIALQQGANTIEISARNACGVSTQTTSVVYSFNCPQPAVQISNPINGTTVENESLTIQAFIANVTNANGITVSINGVNQGSGTYSSTNGLFNKTIRLVNGQNNISITVTNACGSVTESTFVTYQMKCDNPIVVFKSPSLPGSSISTNVYTVVAQLTHVTNAQSISFRVNGNPVSSFDYSPQTGIFKAPVSLISGSNSFEIIATNSCGSTSGVTTINYNYDCPKPVIQIFHPVANESVNLANYTVEAIVSNVTSVSQIQLKLNGVLQPQGTFTSTNKLYKHTLSLLPGSNTIEIIATNNCGSSTQATTMLYREPVRPKYPPVVSFTSACNVEINAGSHHVSGLIANVTNSNQISIQVNGTIVTNASFAQTSTGLNFGFNFNAVENVGTYTIVITAITPDGQDAETCVVTVKKPMIDNDIVICVMEGRTKVTKTIKESQWPQYQAMGATLGKCPEVVDNDIVICVMEGRTKVTKTIKESQWPQYQAMGATLGKCPEVTEQKIKICHYPPGNNSNPQTIEIPASAWPAHQAHGDQLGECPQVVDNDIVICVMEGRTKVTKTIKESQWPQYQAMGATLGKCPEVAEQKIKICHYPPGNNSNPQTIEIPASAWPAHQAHGDQLGECPQVVDNDIVICVMEGRTKVTKTIKESQWPQYQAMGATLGKCPEVTEQKIKICHYPPGNNSNPQTIEIPASAWPAHQAHGDQLGECPQVVDNDIVICVMEGRTKVTKTIKESQWPQYQAMGATLGKCPEVTEQKIKICHYPPGNNSNPQTIEIPASAWPAHQAHGDQLGECPQVVDNDIVICVMEGRTKVTKTIKESQWPQYQSQGATLGTCRQVEQGESPGSNGSLNIGSDEMAICITENGVATTKVIKIADYPTYKANGATKGACPTDEKNPTLEKPSKPVKGRQ